MNLSSPSSNPNYQFHTSLPPRTLSDFIQAFKTQRIQTPPTPSILSTTSTLTSASPLPLPSPNPTQPKMPLRHSNRMVETRTTKPTLMTRLRGRNANSRTVKTTTKIEPASNHTTHTTHATHATRGTHAHNTRRSGWGNNRRTAQPVVHHKRHASIGDKVSGAMMKLRGSLTRRPGLKAAGTRRMHGTDGRGARRVY